MESKRLMSLDVLRGLDMMYLVASATFLVPLLGWFGCSRETVAFMTNHPWEGFAAYDIIMPLFIFMCGAAIPFALGRRMTDGGRPTKAYWRHVAVRFLLLWTLGLVAQGRLLEWNVMTLSPFNNTLQTIAVGYLLTALVLCIRPPWGRLAVTAALPVAYAVFMALGADYGRETNAAIVLERKVLALMCPDGSKAFALNGYTWFATVPMFGFMCLCGFHATNAIRASWGVARKLAVLAAFGGGLLVAGLVAEKLGIPCIKHVFTVSFTLQAMGWCVLLLTALYLLIDVAGLRRGWGLALLFGQTSLFAYMLGDIFAVIPLHAAKTFASGAVRGFGKDLQTALVGIVAFVLVALALHVWRTYRTAASKRALPFSAVSIQ